VDSKDINISAEPPTYAAKPNSIWRAFQEGVSQFAPFLLLDHDPYAVLTGSCMDSGPYTVSDRYPYFQCADNGSHKDDYIRNSVKAVVDMYDEPWPLCNGFQGPCS